MKNLITRALTGAVYVTLTVGSILFSKYSFFVYFTIILAYTIFEFYRLCKIGGNKPQLISGIFTAIFVFVAFFLYDMQMVSGDIFLGLIPLLMIIPVIELVKASKNPVKNIAYTLLGLIYIAFPFSVLNFIATPFRDQPELYSPEILLGLFIILWANDSGAYLVGSTLGKHKLLERVSPKKTWEGTIGGAIFAIIISIVLFRYVNTLDTTDAIILSILTVITGTLGDLTESMIKRNFNVKDSGNIMPGHGGLFDRFDSMLFAAPVYYAYITLILN